ncbi:MAG: hypothetical protein ACYTG0_09485 [Planctomycetota bacterium]|jgi:hypothetical protein
MSLALTVWLAGNLITQAGDGELVKIDLGTQAKAYATHATDDDEFRIENAVDGSLGTHWVGEAHPLTQHPTNIVIAFSEPTVVARLVLVSEIFRDRLALKDFDVYAWAQNDWAGAAPLARVRGTREIRTVVDLPPARTTRLRIRILDNWREDHTYPRLQEIEVYRPASRVDVVELADGPVAGEKPSERVLLRRAMGEKIVYPAEPYDPNKGYLHYARACLDTLISEGTDRYGSVHSPMFASLLDLETRRIPADAPPPVPGQRTGDRAVRGGNLFHDVMTLQACDLVSRLTGDEKYRKAATAYLQFFLKNCPQRTGLFPWGEHAHWDFFAEAPGHPTHEFLGGVPRAFWDRLWTLNPDALGGQADGLINHVVNLETFDFNRHADVRNPLPNPRPGGMGFLDFPRHGGFYVHLWTHAYAKTGRRRYLEWSSGIIDHVWRSRDPKSGLPPGSTTTQRVETIAVESALSFAVSLLEASKRLPEGEARDRYRAVAEGFLDRILELPHRPAEGQFATSFPRGVEASKAEPSYGSPYRYGYGGGFSADDVLLILAAYRITRLGPQPIGASAPSERPLPLVADFEETDSRALRLAEGFADYYANHDPPPPWEIVRAHVYASIIGLFTDLYDLERKPAHLAQAERYAQMAVERLFWRGLFRGATSINHYEGDLMVGSLVYNLAWLHAVTSGAAGEVPPNYFHR